MKLLKVLTLGLIIPFLVIGLSSCNSRELFDVQVRNADAWNDTFDIEALIEEVEYIVEGMENFDYGDAGDEGNAARTATANTILTELEGSDVFNFEYVELNVDVLREDNVFAFRSVVLITLSDTNEIDLEDLTLAANFVTEAANADFTDLDSEIIRNALEEAILTRTLTFNVNRPTTNANIVTTFILYFINDVLYNNDFDVLDAIDANVTVNSDVTRISGTISHAE